MFLFPLFEFFCVFNVLAFSPHNLRKHIVVVHKAEMCVNTEPK